MGKKLFVGNLSWDTDEETLKEFFGQAGTVEDVNIIKDREYNNRSKGFGFVTMASEEEAQEAIDQLNGKSLDGREIRVDVAKPRES